MREILGYAPIEPDGSVRVKVPANVAIQLTVVDAKARRISPLHRNWLQVQVGEVLTCNGCHAPNTPPPPAGTPRSHGRSNLFASINPGAPETACSPIRTRRCKAIPAKRWRKLAPSWICNSAMECPPAYPSVDVIFR